VELASGEPAARHVATSGRAGPPERGGRGQDPRRTSECEERELAIMEKCQNKANFPAWFKYGSQQFLHDLQVIAYWLFCPLLYSAFICEICGPEFGTSSPIG